MRIAGMLRDSLCNGPGIRLTVFTQGCDIHCPGCHNPSSQPLESGHNITIDEILAQVTPITTGITISGGEPTLQWPEVIKLCKRTQLPVMVYTGRTYKEFHNHYELPENIDFVKIGPYIESRRSLTEQYGSTNQKIYKRSDLCE